MGFFAEFKKFITRGNVLDMAIGVIIGGAFTAIVNGVSNYVLKPLINFAIAAIVGKDTLTGAVTFLGEPAYVLDDAGKVMVDEAGEKVIDLANSFYLDWGALIITIINFFITALVLFLIVKAINSAREPKEGALTKEQKKEIKAQGIKLKDKVAVQAYLDKKAAEAAEAQRIADEEAAKAAAEERRLNPTVEDLLKDIKAILAEK